MLVVLLLSTISLCILAWMSGTSSPVAPRCRACRYPVDGLCRVRCPECGSDLHRAGAIRDRRFRPAWMFVGATTLALGLQVAWQVRWGSIEQMASTGALISAVRFTGSERAMDILSGRLESMSDLERRRLLLALWDHDRWQSSWMSDHLLESFEQTPAMHEAMVTPLLERWSDPSQRWTERDAAALQMLDQRGWLTDDERQEIRDGLTRPVLVVDDGTPIAPGDMVGLWFRQDVRSAMLDRARFRMPPEFMICGFGMARAMHRPYDGDVLDAVYALDFHEARPHVTIRARSIERQTPGGDMNVSLAAAMIDRVGAWAIDRVVMPTLHDGPSVSGLPEFLSRDVAHMVVPSGLPEVVGGNDLRLGLRVRLPEIADRVLIRIDVLSNGERHAVTRLTYDRSKTAGLLAGHESIEIDESGFRVQGRRVGLRLLTSGLDVDRLDVHATITHVEQLGTTWTIEHTMRFEDLDVVHLDR